MTIIPSVWAQIDEKEIFKIISNNFSKLAPNYYYLISNWLIRAYNVHKDIDKYIIVIYLVNKDLIVFRRNGLIVDYDTFYRDRTIEIEKINLSDISKDLEIPKESVRRKILELEKEGVIKRDKKKLYIPALKGEKKHVVDVDIPFDIPKKSELSIDTEKREPNSIAEEIIQKLNEEIEGLKDQRLRAVAELANFRKRAEKEQSDALKYGIANFAKEIINIGDNIERAKSSISDDVKSNDSIKSVVEGLDLIAQSTLSTFEKIGIKKIESLNEKFDHNLHQAMMEIEKNDCEPGTIVQELIPGYTLHDRLLRPAMVGVSKKPQENQGAKDTKEEEQSEK